MKRTYLLYDGRACGGQGTDDATVFTCSDSLAEAKRDAEDFGQTAIYSYADRDGELTDERWECDLMDGKVIE